MFGSKKDDLIQEDAKNNRVKEGLLIKQSRHLKQWKQRWMVLTKTHIYSFSQKGVYRNATQVIPLNSITTIKSYYKKQFDKSNVFRIESPDINLYLTSKTNQQKWSWMTAIQKTLHRVLSPQQKPDSHNLIRQTLKYSNAMRGTLLNKQQNQIKHQPIRISTNQISSVINKFKLEISRGIINVQVDSPEKNNKPNFNRIQKKQQENSGFIFGEKPQQKVQYIQKIVQKRVQVPVERLVQKEKLVEVQKEKVVEKVVEKIVQKIVEKVVYVPQIRQKIVQKIIYESGNTSSQKETLEDLFQDIITSKIQNPRPMVQFVIFLMTSNLQKYYKSTVSFCLETNNQRYFAEIFLIMLNQQIDEQKINAYIKFITIIYENTNQYLYSSDIKVLIDIILRDMEMNRSEFNQFLLMSLLKVLVQKSWWKKLSHRNQQLRMMVKELESISGVQNQMLAEQILPRI